MTYFLIFAICLFISPFVAESKITRDPDFTPKVRDRTSSQDGQEQWAYTDVREDAHLFWWLYYTTHADGYLNRPLVIWLQGGPGGSSCGYGNFEIIGPLDLYLQPRNQTWVQSASVLFIDQPVGTGYSYVDNADAYTTDVEEAATDFLTLMTAFLESNPEFQTIPIYVFGQSYGGKMGAVFTQRLHEAVENGELTADVRSIAMGNAWIDPVGSTLSWAPFLYWTSTTDEYAVAAIQSVALQCKQAAEEGRWVDATALWAETEYVLWEYTNYVNFYNILEFETFNAYDRSYKKNRPFGNKYDLILGPMEAWGLDQLMNGPIRNKLEIIPEDVIWGGQADWVFFYQEGDFMKDVIGNLDYLLNYTDIDVIIYQGQLDLICDTKAAMDFVLKLQWPEMRNFYEADRTALTDPTSGQTDLFVKAYNQLKFYWNLRAGHAVPADMPDAALRMLNRILDDTDN